MWGYNVVAMGNDRVGSMARPVTGCCEAREN
jgi:hypothetical protein